MVTALSPDTPPPPRKKRAAPTTIRELSTRDQRKKLAPRDKPYFVDIERGLAIGYRKGSDGGSWLLREFKPDASHKWGGKYVQRRLGTADDTVPADGVSVLAWGDALAAAQSADRPTVTRPGKHTVAAAWEAYRATRKTPLDTREVASWERFIEPQLGAREVSELTSHELSRWLQAQITARGNRGQTKDRGDEKDALRRARYTANRRWNLLRAVLNYAFESDVVPSDAAWRKVKPFRNVDRPRTVTASVEQARALLGKLTGPLQALAKGALFTGLRLGELVGLRVSDVDIAGPRIRVHGKGDRQRFVPLNSEGRDFFAQAIDGKPADALALPPIADDPVVNRVAVARGMKAASKELGISPRLTFHDLRRSWGSLMLNAGAPLEVIQQVLGHADMRMTRRVYSHLLQETVAKQIEKHLPSFADKPKARKRPRH
jgi:integrase